MAKKNTYDPQVNFDAKVNDKGKTLRDEINEAIQIGKEPEVNYVNQVRELLRGEVEQEMLRYVQGIDKSAYARIINNQRVSQDIIAYFKRDPVFNKIQSAAQVQHLQSIFTEHLNIKTQREEILAKERNGQQITAQERSFLEQKSPFETFMDRAAKNYFMDKIHTVEHLISKARDEVLFSNYYKTPQKIKQMINQQLASCRMGSYEFHQKDVSPIFYDDKARDQYVNALIAVREKFKTRESALAVHRNAARALEEAGDMWKGAAGRYHYMTDDEAVQHFKRPKEKISQYEYDKENLKRLIRELDALHKDYDDELKNFHNVEKYVYDHPELKDYLESPEYFEVMRLEYHEGAYEGKTFSQMTSLDQQNYVLDKYGCAELRTIHKEHREAYSLARDKKAQEELQAFEDKFNDAEQRLKAYWGDRPATKEMEIQKLELEENRAIINALRDCITKNSPENEAKYVQAINTAYSNAKQRYIENPDLRERMDLRSSQIDRGDFSFVPISNEQTARLFDMVPIWADKSARFTKEDRQAYRISQQNSFLALSYDARIKPLVQPLPQIQIENERQMAKEYTLEQMARGLDGEDLEAYKADIANRRMEKLEYVRDEFTVKVEALKEQREALQKNHGFFDKLFNSKYKTSIKEIDQSLKAIKADYKAEQDKAKYDILKTYQEKGIALTKAESKELNALEKNATKTGDIKKWDMERAEEKRKIEEYNRTHKEMEAPQAPEKKVASTTQLDLGAQIHKPKTHEAPKKQEATIEKAVEKEQKVQEDPNLEK